MDNIIADQKVARRRRIQDARGAAAEPQARRRDIGLSFARIAPEQPAKRAQAMRAQVRSERASRAARPSGPDLAGIRRKAIDRILGKISGMGAARASVLAISLAGLCLAVALAIGSALRGPAFPMPDSPLLPEDSYSAELLLEYVAPELAQSSDAEEGPDLPPVPATLSYSAYTVRSGDTVGGLARRFGLSMDSIISANGISNAQALRSGVALRIPSMDGLVHRVRPGESIGSIAKQYKTDATRLVDANDLGSSTLAVGQSLFIPGARLPEAALKEALGQLIAWPVRGRISSYYGYRADPFTGVRRFHAGIDIVVDSGTPVRAASSGTVAELGYNATFGNYIIMSHGGGFQTLYGHLSSLSIAKGARVSQGGMIGLSGNTGYSTGPHLHFGLFKNGTSVNPLKYLK